jgi:hypothetical protein
MADPPEIGMIVPKDGNAFEFGGSELDCGLDELSSGGGKISRIGRGCWIDWIAHDCGKIVEMVAMTIVVVKIAVSRLDLVESSWIVAARSSGEIDSALRTRCSSTLSLAGFLPCSSWFLGILQCCVLFHDIDNRSTGLLGCDS